jgi:hypothetical protein
LEHGSTVTADENYIRESILAPGAESGQRIQASHMLVFQGLRMKSS